MFECHDDPPVEGSDRWLPLEVPMDDQPRSARGRRGRDWNFN
jgi:hypothetical protein